MTAKQRAAEAAMDYVHDGMIIGLGTGSTADFFLRALAAALRTGRLRDIRGVPTSRQSEDRANELGIPLIEPTPGAMPDVTIDGADEIDPQLNLIKGLGGALLREKIVAQGSKRLIIIADASKRVDKLGSKAPLPVEVVKFGHDLQADFLQRLGCEPTLRRGADGNPFVTDNGNYIYDCRFPTIPDPAAIEKALSTRAGIVESGLFIGIASIALIADDQKVETLRR